MELITTKVCMAKDIGIHGNLFGGKMLAWLEEAGAAFASQMADTTRMVTKALSAGIFERPVKAGRIVKIYGEPSGFGNTTVNLNIRKMYHV